MGTAVLRSHDCLKHRLHLDFYDSRPLPPMNSACKKPSRSPPPKQSWPARSKPNPVWSGRRSGSPDKTEARKPLVMGQFALLKRGEMPPPAALDGDVLCSKNQMGPDPEILPKISDLKAVYAGPGFNISSPSLSSLPFPAFFLKKTADEAIKSEIATRGLRCLLRLDA